MAGRFGRDTGGSACSQLSAQMTLSRGGRFPAPARPLSLLKMPSNRRPTDLTGDLFSPASLLNNPFRLGIYHTGSSSLPLFTRIHKESVTLFQGPSIINQRNISIGPAIVHQEKTNRFGNHSQKVLQTHNSPRHPHENHGIVSSTIQEISILP